MFTHAKRNLFDDGINQESFVKRFITVTSNGPNVLQHNSGEQPLWRIKPANRNTVLAYFIPNKPLSLIETCHELISRRLSKSFREWNPKSRRNWNACNWADKISVNTNFDNNGIRAIGIMEIGKEKYEEETTQSEDTQTILRQIIHTINKQVVGLQSTIDFYNLHLLLQNPHEKPLIVTVGGLQYTSNVELLKHRYLIEENYWKNYLQYPLKEPNKIISIQREATPPSGFERIEESPLGEGEESPLAESKISGFSSFPSSENLNFVSEVEGGPNSV
jgi:hypothetical protein